MGRTHFKRSLADIGHHGPELLIREPGQFSLPPHPRKQGYTFHNHCIYCRRQELGLLRGLEGMAVRLTSTIKDSIRQKTEKKTYLMQFKPLS